ncbi:alpha/beta hydrolase fold domain-containing protein [Olsenella urininfantis]|uniref:alpha/beta hydrolase fold domain-containing protein n=1 Tax=Olsenella urininfantis TaxID=1871033 RepID=UPI000984BFB5|nr:alpha/beta hydrolase [Olsenella urininfantis]
MDKTSKQLLGAAAGIAAATAAVAGIEALSRLRWKRSGIASAWAGYSRLTGSRKDILGQDLGRFDDYVERHRQENEQEYHIPGWLRLRSLVFEETVDGMKTFHLGTTGKNERAVLYLHGGGYIGQIGPWQWLFADRVCQDSGAEVFVPIYPLAPAHDYDEAYSLLTDLYEGMVDRYGADNVTLVGDSAGGGLAAGLAESFGHYDLPQPGQLVLVSPELDLTMRNPEMHDYFDVDPTLAPWGLAQVGQLWSDGDDLSSFRLSPINGSVEGLRNVTTFVGTREIFYPDCVKWDQMLELAGVSHELVVGEGLNHEWPLCPIPEARSAQRRIAELVKAKVGR